MSDEEGGCIYDAVRSGSVQLVRKILQRDPSCVNEYDVHFQTPLQLVYRCTPYVNPQQADDRLPVMQLLIDYGADINMRARSNQNSSFTPVLIEAAGKNQIEGVALLLKNKADPNIINTFGTTALLTALKRKVSESIITMLLDHKADPNTVDLYDRTPLELAVAANYSLNPIEKLVACGAKCKNIYECLLKACKPDQQQILEYLLKNATEIDSHGQYSSKALVYYIESTNHHLNEENCILKKLLLQQGINFDIEMGNSELHLAVNDKNESKVKTLLQNGADVNVKNIFGNTPLHLLIGLKYNENRKDEQFNAIGRLLIEYGADLRARNVIDETPFYLAVKKINETNDKDLMLVMLTKITGIQEIKSVDLPPRTDEEMIIPFDKNDIRLNELLVAITLGYEQLVDRLLDLDYVHLASKNFQCEDVNVALSAATNLYKTTKMLLEAGFQNHEYFRMFFIWETENEVLYSKIACLFWEYKNHMIVSNMIHDAFSEVIIHSAIYPEEETRIYLMAFFYAMLSRSNNLNSDLVALKGVLKENTSLSNAVSVCNEKLDELDVSKLFNGLSIYDIIMMPLDKLVKLLNNIKYFNICMFLRKIFYLSTTFYNYEYLEYVIKTRLDLACEKRKILDIAKNHLNKALKNDLNAINLKSLPDEIVWKIFDNLNMRDLKKLAKMDTNITTDNNSDEDSDEDDIEGSEKDDDEDAIEGYDKDDDEDATEGYDKDDDENANEDDDDSDEDASAEVSNEDDHNGAKKGCLCS